MTPLANFLSTQQCDLHHSSSSGNLISMTEQLRAGILAARPAEVLEGVVECDEVYVTAGHKGQPAVVAKKVARAAPRPEGDAWLRHAGEGEAAYFRHGSARWRHNPASAGQCSAGTIKPLLLAGVALGSLINTDEYAIYGRLPEWGFGHKTVNHGRGEYARDEDGDGFCEVHVNTMEGVWSLLRSWLRPHRGIS